MSATILKGADLSGAIFNSNTNLTEAILIGVDLQEVDFKEAKLTGVIYNSNENIYIDTTNNKQPPCLKKGTHIKTKIGCVPIETLTKGDFLLDEHGNEIEIINLVKSTKTTSRFNILKKNKLGINVPNKDLVISDLHLVKHNGRMYLPDKFKRLPKQEIEYYHIETANYNTDWFIVNNCIVETFTDGNNKSHLEERMKRMKRMKRLNLVRKNSKICK